MRSDWPISNKIANRISSVRSDWRFFRAIASRISSVKSDCQSYARCEIRKIPNSWGIKRSFGYGNINQTFKERLQYYELSSEIYENQIDRESYLIQGYSFQIRTKRNWIGIATSSLTVKHDGWWRAAAARRFTIEAGTVRWACKNGNFESRLGSWLLESGTLYDVMVVFLWKRISRCRWRSGLDKDARGWFVGAAERVASFSVKVNGSSSCSKWNCLHAAYGLFNVSAFGKRTMPGIART